MFPPSPINNPTLRDDLPRYPPLNQVVRVTAGTVPGPSGYMSSSVLGPSLYVGFVQQLHSDTIMPRDREPCFVLDLNRYGLAPGYYNARLGGSYQSLPVYEVGSAANSVINQLSFFSGLTSTQVQQLSTLTPAQFAVLGNLSPCQLQTLLTTLPISQIQTLTLSLTPTQLTNFISYNNTTQLLNLYSLLTTSQVRNLTALNIDQVYTLTSVLTPTQIQTLIVGLTSTQLQTLTQYPSTTVSMLVNSLSTVNLSTLLSTTPLPTVPINIGLTQTAGFTSGTQNNVTVFGSLLRVPTTGATTITGITPANTGAAQFITIANTGSSTLTIANQNSGSATTSQFKTSTGSDLSIPANSSMSFLYDVVNGYYRDVSAASGAVSGGSAASWTVGTIAAAGSNQGDATVLTYWNNDVTGADYVKGVKLDASYGMQAINNSDLTNGINVYPPTGGQINSLGTNNPYTHSLGSRVAYWRFSATQWYTQLTS